MLDKKITVLVDESQEGMRADIIIANASPLLSRSQALKLFHSHKVTVNGQICKPSYRGEIGDIFAFEQPENKATGLEAYPQDLHILFEDEWILVVNKPPDLVVHPAPGHPQDTLVNVLIHHQKKLSSGPLQNEDTDRPGIVHRLDKDTSGLLVIAKNNLAHRALAQQFESRLVTRCYWALVFGTPRNTSGQIITRIARHARDRKRFQSVLKGKRGRKAITHYQVIQSQNQISLLHLKLETGRTHQIRVHLSEQNHPILGDWVYGKKHCIHTLPCQLQKAVKDLPRLALHAAKLGFLHPYHKQYLEFEVGWPPDLLELLSIIQMEV